MPVQVPQVCARPSSAARWPRLRPRVACPMAWCPPSTHLPARGRSGATRAPSDQTALLLSYNSKIENSLHKCVSSIHAAVFPSVRYTHTHMPPRASDNSDQRSFRASSRRAKPTRQSPVDDRPAAPPPIQSGWAEDLKAVRPPLCHHASSPPPSPPQPPSTWQPFPHH